MNQLIRVTNAYSGAYTYIAQDKIVSFYADVRGKLIPSYKHIIGTWVNLLGEGTGEDSFPVAEPVEYFLAKFPPL